MAERRTPDHPIDAFIGLRVRERRVFLQLSIAELAARIGVEPNDLEEYETGERPTSAGELHALSKALGVPVSHFFKGIESKASLSRGDVLADSEVAELVRLYFTLPEDKRRRLLEWSRGLKKGA